MKYKIEVEISEPQRAQLEAWMTQEGWMKSKSTNLVDDAIHLLLGGICGSPVRTKTQLRR